MIALDTFKRVEDKYIMTKKQAARFMELCSSHLKEDTYFRYTVRSVYFDSERSDLVIRSLMKPDYKMKLRLRSYCDPQGDTPVFLETKKEFEDIIYKRRIGLSYDEAIAYLDYGIPHHVKNNTADEIDYLLNYYNLSEKVMIAYDRECYASKTEDDVRITFDSNVRYRIDGFSMVLDGSEKRLTDEDTVVMEVKAMDRYPLWLTKTLSAMKLYRGSFSKYGKIYTENFEQMAPVVRPVYTYENQMITEGRICSVQY